MARPRVIARLKRLRTAYQKLRMAGFTLIELLVAMFVGGIITVALLSLVIQLVDVNQRDASRSDTQRDMQAAINYISQELREAVFVYDGDCLQGSVAPSGITATNFSSECPGVLNFIPPGLTGSSSGDTNIPVLAFWRADPLPQGLLTECSKNSDKLSVGLTDPAYPSTLVVTDSLGNRSAVPCISGRSYTLVVYVLVDDGQPNDIWQGRARLLRYQLSQFKNSAATGADTNVGYVDPLSSPSASFQQWPFQIPSGSSNPVSVQAVRPDDTTLSGNSAVLVDFVDDTLRTTSACPDRATSTTPFAATPRSDATFNPNKLRSFYACIRGQTYQSPTAEQSVNQEVQLFLAGNVQGRPGFPITATLPNSTESQVFPIETRVLTRGIINKSPKS